MAVDFAKLFGALVPAISCGGLGNGGPGGGLDDGSVGEVFRRAMAALVTFDNVVVFAYRGAERPIDLYNTFDEAGYEIYVSLYQAGPYLLDPFFHTARSRRSGVFRMRELAPDRFFSSEYYRTYYVQTGLAEETGFFVPLDGDIAVVLSLMRLEGTGAFPAAELQLLAQAEPLVAALVRAHWGGLGPRFDAQGASGPVTAGQPAAPSLGVWQRLGLTGREADIVDLVLQGHSSESIGLRLDISTGTVKVHRRNVYRKLGISSQIQLLSIYLKNLG